MSFAGAFVALAGLAVLAIAVLSRVDIPKLPPALRAQQGRPLRQIMAQPKFVVAVICAMISYAMMSLVMTATPIAMVACGFGIEDAAFVVQWHAVAMFAPSFFTGNLIARFGAPRIILVGLTLLAACGAVALSGIAIEQFSIALILLGLGWNFGFVGATSLVTETYRPQERNKVQAANDLLVFGTVASASLMSGILLQNYGWSTVNMTLFPFVVFAGGLVIWSTHRARPNRLSIGAANNFPPTAGDMLRRGTTFGMFRALFLGVPVNLRLFAACRGRGGRAGRVRQDSTTWNR